MIGFLNDYAYEISRLGAVSNGENDDCPEVKCQHNKGIFVTIYVSDVKSVTCHLAIIID